MVGLIPGGVKTNRVKQRVKEDTKATTRCIPIDQEEGSGSCIVCGKKATKKVYFARSY